MRDINILLRAGLLMVSGCCASPAYAEEAHADPTILTVDPDGTVHIPAFAVPYTSLASPQAKQQYLDTVDWLRRIESAPALKSDTAAERAFAMRRFLDEDAFKPGLARLRAAFAVDITPKRIGGVQTDIVTPAEGVSKKNANRVLINLHGGSFALGARLGGQMESVPIASLGAIKVITVDYRMWPEHHFPAASEDVAKVYGELLKQYRPENIGIYGCSAGSVLTAQSVAWFQEQRLPRPGAIGLFGAGALLMQGDSNYTGAALAGFAVPAAKTIDLKAMYPYLDVRGLDIESPVVSPAFSLGVLARFPPTLLISGTRDSLLSGVVYTHAQLIKAGVDARLHVWEGAPHCAFAQPIVDPDQPESREAWSVIIKFFDSQLGK